MNLNPKVLDPVFQFLDGIIAKYGDYLFLAFVWLSLLVLAWVFSGGLRRKFPGQPHVRAGIGIIIQSHTPPPPIVIHEYDPPDDGCVANEKENSDHATKYVCR